MTTSRWTRLRLGAGLVAAGAAVAGALVALRGGGALPLAAQASGATVGRALAAPVLAAEALWLPARCHAPDAAPRTVAGWTVEGGVLRGQVPDGLVLGVVASARDAASDTLAAARHVAGAFARAGVGLVLVLGGLPGDEAGERAVLEALAPPAGARWAVVALPGDREHLAAHRAAIDVLAARGAPIFDGARLLAVHAGGATIALLPGLPAPPDAAAPLLVAGADGCAYDAEDVARAAAALATHSGPRVAATVMPPRQTDGDATDVGDGGLHVGDPTLAPLLAAADLALHGWLDAAAGERATAGQALVVGAAPLDPASLVAPGWRGGGVIVRLPRVWKREAPDMTVELVRVP